MNENKKNPNGILRLTLVLFAICAVTSLLLSLVNLVTKDRIAAINEEKTAAAMRSVLPSDAYTEVAYTGDDPIVKEVNIADDKGYVVEVVPSGFGGDINMVVGVGTDGTITGVSVINMSETSGLGTNAMKDEFRNQYVGGSGPFQVNKDGGTIDAITGATITSRAVTNGVNAALEAVKTLG